MLLPRLYKKASIHMSLEQNATFSKGHVCLLETPAHQNGNDLGGLQSKGEEVRHFHDLD